MNSRWIIILIFIIISCNRPASVRSESIKFIAADDPNIQYSGRIDFSNPKKPAFTFPGVSVKFKFKGTGADIVMKNYSYNSRSNYFNIIIDGKDVSVLKASAVDTIYTVANNLSDSLHTIEVFKRTESNVGKTEFLGVRIFNGTELEMLSAPLRKMEFIGNSITCGYGNEASNEQQHFGDSTENNYMAFGAITARNLNAQYVAVCYSGKGIYRNYGGSEEEPLPLVYNRIFPDEKTPLWNFKNYTPDVVVIDLGTNDFSQAGTDSSKFVTSYKTFLSVVRSDYPDAHIFCVVGPMMNDYYPVGEKSWTKIKAYLQFLVNDLNREGDLKIYFYAMSPQGAFGMGADYHPNVRQHIYNSNELTDFIKKKAGW